MRTIFEHDQLDGASHLAKKSIPVPPHYLADDIKALRGIEGIRTRPAMYIGDTGSHGLHHVFQSLIHDELGEFLSGNLSSIDVHIQSDGRVLLYNDSPGLALDAESSWSSLTTFEANFLHRDLRSPWYSKANVGFGMLIRASIIANALSERLIAANYRDGYVWTLKYKNGQLTSPLKRGRRTDRTGLVVFYKFDADIFTDRTFDHQRIRQWFEELACLVPGVTLRLRDARIKTDETFYSPEGIASLVKLLNQQQDVLFPEVFMHQATFDGARLEVAFQPTTGFESNIKSYVNAEPCNEGTHIIGFRAGLMRGLENYAREHGLVSQTLPGINHYYEGMTAVVSLWLDDPMYEGPTRFKLHNREVVNSVAQVVQEGLTAWAKERPDCLHQLIEKAVLAAEMDDSFLGQEPNTP